MTVHTVIRKKFSKYLPANEKILATIYCERILARDSHWVCVTKKRFGWLERKNAFSWKFGSFEFNTFRTAWVDESLFKSKIKIICSDEDEIVFKNINRKDARDFVGKLLPLIEKKSELLSQRTKVCPVCDETVKYRAKRCKYCGETFN